MLLSLILNKVGDNILPCGTPCSWLKVSDNVAPILILKDLSDKKFDIKLGNQPLKPMSCKSFMMPYFHVVLYAFFKINKYCDDMFLFDKCITNKRF